MNLRAILKAFVFLGALMAVSLAVANSNANAAKSSADIEEVVENVKIGEFDKIEVSQGIQVAFRQTDNPGYAKIKSQPDNIKKLCVECDGNELKIHFKNNLSIKDIKGPVIVTVSSNDFKGAEVMSAAKLAIIGDLKVANKVEIEASSGGSVSVGKINCHSLEIDCSSSANVIVKSVVGALDVDASSAAKIAVDEMKGEKLDADASSASSVVIKGIKCNIINADASSAASITLTGVCNKLIKESSSAASLSHKDLYIRQK